MIISCSQKGIKRRLSLPNLSSLAPFSVDESEFLEQLQDCHALPFFQEASSHDATSPEAYLEPCNRTRSRVADLARSLQKSIETMHGRLARRVNMRAPISKLSDDILRIIFNFCCETAAHEDAMACAKGLAEVCTRWRAVARDNAAMWSRFDLSNVSDLEAEAFFRLSRGCKKRIIFGHSDGAARHEIIQLLNQHVDSVAELNLYAKDERSCFSWLEDTLSAPALHTFSLRLSDGWEPPYRRTTSNHPFLVYGARSQRIISDLSAFVDRAPHLRHITLDGARAPWTKESYRNLTTLRLSNCVLDAHHLDKDIFDTLRGSPRLQELQLHMICDDGWRPATDRLMVFAGDSKVPLSSLRVLRLSLPHPYVFYLLRSLDIPQQLQILDLNIGDYEAHHNINAPSRIFVPSAMSLDILADVHSARIELRDGDTETIELSGDYPQGHFRRRVSWKRRAGGQKIVHVLKTLIEHHHEALASVQSFELVSHENISYNDNFEMPQKLPTLVARLTNVVSLKLSTTDHNQLLPRVSRFRFPHLASFSVVTSSLQPVPAIRTTWLPSLHANCPQLKHFELIFNPQAVQETLGGPRLKGATESDVALAREELEAISRGHTNVSVTGYAYVRSGEDGMEGPQSTQIWPMAERELAPALDAGSSRLGGTECGALEGRGRVRGPSQRARASGRSASLPSLREL